MSREKSAQYTATPAKEYRTLEMQVEAVSGSSKSKLTMKVPLPGCLNMWSKRIPTLVRYR